MSSAVSLEYLNSVLPTSNPTGTNLSAFGSSASVTVVLGGSAVPLATTSSISGGITVRATNTQWSVTTAGLYYISYRINTTLGLGMQASVYKNGAAIPALTTASGLTVSNFVGEAIVPLAANDILQLTLFGLAGTAVLTSGVGAALVVIRLS